MSINSYAQNFEDVMLWRALQHVEHGFYIDLGAQHPSIDSVSQAFYERGWRGLLAEATPAFAELLRRARPDETVLQVAVGDHAGTMRFYEVPDTGISTGDAAIAEQHRQRGFSVNEIVIPCITLAEVFEQAGARDIHWMKIDVEGMEFAVLNGWGDGDARPWIVVVESTLPLTQQENHHSWENLLFERGYSHVYFDGLNRYYVSAEHPELAGAFDCGPNVFDGFTLEGTASATFCLKINERHRQREAALAGEFEQARAAHEQARESLLADLRERDARLLEAGAEVEALRQTLAGEATAHRDTERSLRELATETFRRSQSEAQNYLRSAVQREQAFAGSLDRAHAQLLQARDDAVRQERDLHARAAEELRLFRADAEAQRQLLQAREREITQEQRELREAMAQAAQAASLNDTALRDRMAQAAQLAARSETALREQVVQAAQAAALEDMASRERLAQAAQAAAEKEQALHERMRQAAGIAAQNELALRNELARAAQAAMQKERALRDLMSEAARLAQVQSEAMLHRMMAREREVAVELEQLRLQLAEQRHAGEIRERELQQGAAAELSRQLSELGSAGAAREKKLREQAARELDLALAERQRAFAEVRGQLEARLNAELAAERETGRQLEAALLAVRERLASTHASSSWRMTAPWRALLSVFAPQATLAGAEPERAQPGPVAAEPAVARLAPTPASTPARLAAPADFQPAMIEPVMPITTVNTSIPAGPAGTLDELLGHHDQAFVLCAYRTLLGREPDAEGAAYYLRRLRAGFSKTGLLRQLKSSSEGRAHPTELPGLDETLRRLKLSDSFLFGGFYARLKGIESNSPIERKLRAIENQVAQLGAASQQRFNELQASIDIALGANAAGRVAAPSGATRGEELAAADAEMSAQVRNFQSLSLRGRNVYFQLVAATAENQGGN